MSEAGPCAADTPAPPPPFHNATNSVFIEPGKPARMSIIQRAEF
jgi:hypothetical protein